MFQSLKYSNLILRISLALVFFWFGVDKFIHPDYWLNAWVPQSVLALIATLRITGTEFIYMNAVFEILVATSMVTDIFTSFFAILAVLFLISVTAFHGFSEVLVRDVGLMGAFLSILFWPKKRPGLF